MSAKTDHYCFPQPKNKKKFVWRYINFTKFFSLISTKTLFLSRADRLDDPFEGSYSKANIQLRSKVYKDIPKNGFDKMNEQMSNFARWIRQWTFINCWHMSDDESAAMWRLYTKSNEAVAIQTTYENLVKALPEFVYVGLVEYIDYKKDWVPEGNSFYPFMHKRKSFAHENEIRTIHQRYPTSKKGILVGVQNDKDGESVDVNLTLLIDKVYVAPTASTWYRNLVEEVLKKYVIDKKVELSNLDEKPVY